MRRRVVRAACAAAVATGLLLSVGGGTALGGRVSAPPSWRATPSPFRLTFRSGSGTTVAEAAASGRPGGRLGYVLADGSTHGLRGLIGTARVAGGSRYRVATDEPGRTALVTVRRVGSGVSVSLRLVPAAGVAATFEAFASREDEHFLGGGERPGALDLRGQALAIKTSYACRNTMPAPFFLGSAGYGAAILSTAIAALAFPGSDPAGACAGGPEPICPLAAQANVVQLCLKAPALAYRLFFGTPLQVASAYSRLVGRPQLPPPSEFELIKWRDIVSGPSGLYDDVDHLRAADIPIGWVLLDNPWERGLCYGNLQFDPTRFPDPAGMIQALHAEGVRLMLWVSPLVRLQWCPPPPQYPPSALIDAGGSAATLDLTDAATTSTFEAGLQALIQLGVDGFKGDRGDEFDLESRPVASGSGAVFQNTYPLLFQHAVAAAARAAGVSGPFPTIFRAAAPGSAANAAGFWAGDQPGTFDGLKQAIHDGLSASVAGYSIWGSDIGGYANVDPPLSAEVFVRWAQFSAVSPIFEVGGIGRSATFWDFGARTVGLFRAAAVLHYELFPYLYGLARTAHATGLPVLRPLALAAPGDPHAWSSDLEAMVGPDLLAAPVTSHGIDASVYLPPGSWVDLASGLAVAGGGSFVRPTPLSELPLYLRSGSAIPFAARTPSLWPRPWPTDALTMPGRGGWLYAPAQGTTRERDAAFGRLRAVDSGSAVELELTGAPAQMQVLMAGSRAPRTVEIDGRVVPRAASLAALRSEPTGWLPVRRPYPGIVLKLAPTHGATTVRLRYP